jgi:hypothetical protein
MNCEEAKREYYKCREKQRRAAEDEMTGVIRRLLAGLDVRYSIFFSGAHGEVTFTDQPNYQDVERVIRRLMDSGMVSATHSSPLYFKVVI